jgi:8-oxo-dGTP pyrophosphatase MutT (NUDIX family)
MTLPPDPLERARAILAGTLPPVAARHSATVALVRDGAAGLEVYLLRRVRGMSFAAGMHVFPGGSVDPGDAHADPWAGPAPAWWAEKFATDEPCAVTLVTAAVRETFEEAGVLLAGPSATTMVDDVSGPAWEGHRIDLEAGRLALPDLLRQRGLRLRADLLAPLAHWVTPEVEPKRFDTRFFLAALPPGQAAQEVGTEADRRVWVSPRRALEEKLEMLPPTAAVLADLARFDDVASALAAERTITAVRPRLEVDGDRLRLVV